MNTIPKYAYVMMTAVLLAGCGSSSGSSTGLDQGLVDAAPQDLALDESQPADTMSVDELVADASVSPDATVLPEDLTPSNDLPSADAAVGNGCIQGSFFPYYGVLHSHTGYSDGKKTPQEAFKYARDVAKLDILVVTDHLEQLYLPVPVDRYGKCKTQAAAELKAGKFVAACGFEYGSGFTPYFTSTGHANVFFSPNLMPAIQLDFHDFYKNLAACGTCVGQFNHPGSSPDEHFNHFEYNAAADAKIDLFEFNSKPAWTLFFEALDAGWHLSPVKNQDNHSADWGTADEHRSGLFMSALNVPSMAEAMRQRRTFMTYDKNAAIKMMAGNCWMGSVLTGVASVTLTVTVTDADSADAFDTIKLFGKGQKLLNTKNCNGANPCVATFAVQAAQSPYFVPRAKQKDGDLLVSAPIWLAP